MLEIAHELSEHITGAFLPLVAEGYNNSQYYLQGVALVEFEGQRYFAATDGFTALFYKTDVGLPLGDYKGLPYLVTRKNDPLSRNLKKAILQLLAGQPQYRLEWCESALETTAMLGGTDVYLASVVDDAFSISMKRPHTHIIGRERLDVAIGAMGGFKMVRCSEPLHQIALFSNNGFAVIMPMHQGKAEIKISPRSERA